MYAKIKHRILTDEVTFDLPANAFALFVRMIVWSSREESDGRVPMKVVRSLGSLAGQSELTRRSLVVQVDGHLVIKSYLKHQTSKLDIEVKRAKATTKKKGQRETRPRGTDESPSTENIDTDNKEQSTKDRDTPPKPPGAKKRKSVPKAPTWRFVPEDWSPGSAHLKKANRLGVDFETELDKFRNWEFKSPKTDTDRAFHTWLGNATPSAPRRGGSNRGTTTPQQAQMDRQMERIRQAEAEEKADTNHPQIVEMNHDQN